MTTNPDSTTTQLSYGGCGCAGGEVVTSRDERGRQKKAYHDAMGRMRKVEELNYDASVYSTGVYAYNARDQITSIRQYKGAETSGVYQERTFHYDGHGRLDSRTTPEQGTCSYSYNGDDTLRVMTDARGVTQTYQYTARRLPYSITFGAPTGVAATPNVTFDYDAAGNRTQMTDGLGSESYSYDTMGRMTQESRTFTGVGTFPLTYTYNNAGLASVTGPPQYGSPQVSYTVDHTGATTSVNGSGPTSAPVYAQNIQYRASGGLKSESYGNGRSLSVTYDNRLRMKRWDVAGVMGWDYSYTDFGENTRRVTYAQNLYDATLSRSYDYDSVGRLLNSYTGTEALAHTGRGGAWGVHDGPYSQAYIKDEWGNVTQKMGRDGDADQFTATYTNNRRDGFTYDSSGNLIYDGGQTFTYDATGQQATASYGGYSLTNSYDGDGQRVRKVENGVVTYYVRSSVMGGRVIVESNSAGGWYRGYVYDSGGGLIGIQANGVVTWAYEDAATKSQRLVDASGNVTAAVDLDPWGLETSRSWNSQQQTHRYTTYERDGNQSDDAMARRYNRWHMRFDEPDPYDGSYNLSDPQSLNRYSYTGNDPVNFTDPSGAMASVYCNNPEYRSKCADPGIIPDSSWDWMERWLNQYDYLSGLSDTTEKFPETVVNKAKDRIKNKGQCGGMFKDKGVQNALDKLDELFKNGNIIIGDLKLANGQHLTDKPNTAAVVVDGKIYFNPKSKIWAATVDPLKPAIDYFPLGNLSREDALAVLLLHELLHAVGEKGPDASDNGGDSESITNSLLTRRNCFPETFNGMLR